MKAIVISIRPEHALDILKGHKKLELRKSVPKGFVGWVYGYVTKGEPRLFDNRLLGSEDSKFLLSTFMMKHFICEFTPLNGTIPFRFWFEEYDKYTDVSDCGMTSCGMECENDFTYKLYDLDDELEKLCLTYNEVDLYGQGKDLYAWHIKKLEVFDKPMELEEFWNFKNDVALEYYLLHEKHFRDCELYPIVTKAPKSWQYVYVKGDIFMECMLN